MYLIEILHQTTTRLVRSLLIQSCILSKFYIKPQLIVPLSRFLDVVSYRNSTSNHNFWRTPQSFRIVVSYRNSTSNHNIASIGFFSSALYLIEILHQTTTIQPLLLIAFLLYLIEILHQTTTTTAEL